MLLESLLRLKQVRPGFDATHLLSFQLTPPPARYPNIQAWSFHERLIAMLEARPGVEAAAISTGVPFGAGAQTRTPLATVGRSTLATGQSVPTDWRSVSPDFLRALKIPLVSGRFFTSHDVASARAVAVVTQRTATIFWGAEDPLGKVIRVVGSGREFTIVGVAADVLKTSLNQLFIPAIYFSGSQRGWPTMDIVIRTTGKPELAIAEARRTLRDLDPALPFAT